MESPLKGKVLIAVPELLDPNFARAVVLIIQHDENGAMGLILNRPLETTVQEAWTQVSSVPYPNADPLYQGGPCEGPLMVLHQDPNRAQTEITDEDGNGGGGVYLSTDADAVRALVTDALEPIKFFVGYAGWSAEQLESELKQGAWLVAPLEPAYMFSTPPELWLSLLKQTRHTTMPAVDPRRIPPDPSVN
ncbi:MAG: YqgE/AlgH family protein [Phycisphaerales bacterium]|nr:YqgE/AlgH family protein [Phycisphaerales bacterium]